MNHELAKEMIGDSYDLIEVKPRDRLDYLDKALQVKQIILGCMRLLDDLKGSPYLGTYTEEDLSLIHESFCVSAIPLVQMIEHFLEKSREETEKYSLAV